MNLIVDANSILSISFYSRKNEVFNPHEFYNVVQKMIDRSKATQLVFCFDSETNWRKTILPEYKANREPNETRYEYINYVEGFLRQLGFQVVKVDGYEADDVVASVIKWFGEGIIASGDQDLFQLVNDKVKIFYKNAYNLYDKLGVKRTGKVFPNQIVLYKTLKGDSDNIKGVSGIGVKTAQKIVDLYKSLDEIYTAIGDGNFEWSRYNQTFLDDRDLIYAYYDIIELQHPPIDILFQNKLPSLNGLVPLLKGIYG